MTRVELNGVAATADDLRHLVQTNYGHFTAMRVEEIRRDAADFPLTPPLAAQAVPPSPAMRARDVGGPSSTAGSPMGGVRGLDLHLDRLDAATQALFGMPLDRERVRIYLRHAIVGARDLSLRVNVFSQALDREHLARAVEPDVLVIASEPRAVSVEPLRVKSFAYARDAAAIKHVGTFPLFHYRRLAQQAGFDDALFADTTGRISEGSIWNIGFVDAHGVVWPDAPQLVGTSMQLLQVGLARAGIACATRAICLDELRDYRAAFFTNASVPVRPIASIDAHRFDIDDEVFAMLTRCYESNPPQAV